MYLKCDVNQNKLINDHVAKINEVAIKNYLITEVDARNCPNQSCSSGGFIEKR
jgi:hypothetical protein